MILYDGTKYTPYGEEWIDKFQDENYVDMPYKFTGKERDEAWTITCALSMDLYYYGARYLDPKYSRWLSTDPALKDYVSKDYDGASGGIFNSVNLNLYHYGNNNPIKYVDPDGRDAINQQTSGYILLRLENPVVIPLYNENGNREIDKNGQKVSFEIDTLVLAAGEKAFGAFDGGKDQLGDYFKVTAKDGTVVDFTVTDDNLIITSNNLKNSVGDLKKNWDNRKLKSGDKGWKETSGFKKANSQGAKFLKDCWDSHFRSDIGENSYEDAYKTKEQASLRSYLNVQPANEAKNAN